MTFERWRCAVTEPGRVLDPAGRTALASGADARRRLRWVCRAGQRTCPRPHGRRLQRLCGATPRATSEPPLVWRHVAHTIRHVPEGGVTYEAFCVAADCGAESGPHAEQEAAQDWALQHAGRTGRDLFRRVFTGHAKVARAE
uniref:DUF7848 domain-containing protein n=1 Tax=Streptomyces fradiae TaxID=1906 RepID=UPI003F8DC2EF